MSGYFIRHMETGELKDIYQRIKEDFPPEEHAPYTVFYKQLKGEIQEGLVFCDGKRDLAYSVCAVSDNDYVLVSLLAVFKEFRAKGIGSAFMKALSELYADKSGILVEVERPELAKTEKDYSYRLRRINFYEKAGFYLIKGINYSIWDVPMHLMALPLSSSVEIVEKEIEHIMYQIYFRLLGEQFIQKMQFE